MPSLPDPLSPAGPIRAALAALPSAAQTPAAPDTVVTVVARDALGTAADVSLVVLGAFLLILLLVLVVLLLQLRKLNGTLRSLGEKALDRADPILERGRGVADNVEFISAVVRTDVERVSDTVKALNRRLAKASDQMEERIDEFNALMEVVQGEAESVFLGTAATARGVKEGVRTLRSPAESTPPHDEDEVFLTGAEKPGRTRGATGAPASSDSSDPPQE